jgi:hypothetical protein
MTARQGIALVGVTYALLILGCWRFILRQGRTLLSPRAFVAGLTGASLCGALIFVVLAQFGPSVNEPGSLLTWNAYVIGTLLCASVVGTQYSVVVCVTWAVSVSFRAYRGTPTREVLKELLLGSRRYAEYRKQDENSR